MVPTIEDERVPKILRLVMRVVVGCIEMIRREGQRRGLGFVRNMVLRGRDVISVRTLPYFMPEPREVGYLRLRAV